MKKGKNLNVWLAMSMFLLMMVSTAAAQTIYVDDDATGANNGSSWTDAYNYLQDALAAASSGDEIWVAQGIYKPDQGAGITPGDREATFQLINGVSLKGGYAGFGEPDPNARDIELYETILSGDLFGNDGPGFVNNGDNSYHVVTGSGTDTMAILEGFTITAGNANGDYYSEHACGGGMYNNHGNLTLVNCTFSGNSAKSKDGWGGYGGGMYNEYGAPTLTNCTFSNNSARNPGFPPGGYYFVGGGMYNHNSNPMLTNCTFSGNSGECGGGMGNRYSSPTLTNCLFSGNWAQEDGGGMYNIDSSPTLTNCTFSSNSAVWGGGMGNDLSNPTLTNCTFTTNSARYHGGGMFNSWNSRPVITNCTFSGNSAVERGGGMHNHNSDPMLTNCTFNGNTSGRNGGGMYNSYQSSPTLTNCTFAGNSAVNGNALACNSYRQKYPSNLQLSNCILWDGEEAIWNNDGSTISISYSDVQGGWTGLGNIDVDPLFVEPGYWADANDPNVIVEPNDPDAVWVEGDYHLKSEGWRWDTNRKVWTWDDVTSPCIDAGNPGCALGDELLSVPDDPNNEWGENLRINMGAYGGTAEASMGLPGWALLADLTNDGIVDFVDLAAFVEYWLDSGQCIPSDLNRSQSVDFVDFAIFARQRRGNNYILLEIYSDGWGGLLETATMEEEGQITILVYEEEPYNYPPAMYYVYASRDGYYTEIYYCEASGSPPNNFITVDVDLDPIVSGKFNGVIFMTQSFFSDRYLPNTDVTVKEGETVVTEFQTDQQGRFATEIEPGNYDFEFISGWQEYRLEPVSIGGEYQDFFFPADIMVVLKPNIYLYPEETIELDVDIVFPHGGRITTSIPDYNDGWHITVEPSGIIDGQFEYLFYESVQPDYGQYAAGWVVIREQLEGFFRNNMGQTGFNQKEIDDFIEYWIPILTEYPYYAIYPQYKGELEEMIKLEFSAQPESLIRLIYSVRGLEDNNLNIQEPVIPPFTRDGFTVTEWGVILK